MIVRDGWPFILVGLILTVIFVLSALRWDSQWLILIASCLAALTVFTTFFFRDPIRTVEEGPLALVSPADGRVVAIERIDNHPHLGGPATRISIFLSIFDVHINRVPASGTIDYVKYKPGRFLAAFKDKASDLNEQTEIGLTTTGGHRLVVKQIAGMIARRIVCRLRQGDIVTAGEKFGMIRFGSRTDLIVPAGSDIRVKVGDHVKGGTSIVGYLPQAAASKPEPSVSTKQSDAGL